MSQAIAQDKMQQDLRQSVAIQLEVIDDFDQLERCATAWSDLLEQSGGGVYFTIDWMRAWWHQYGMGRTLRVIVARRGDRIVGGLPICDRTIGFRPLGIRLAQFVGADSTIPVLTPPIVSGFEEAVIRASLDLIFNEWNIDALSLSPISGGSPFGPNVRSACQQDGACTIARDQSIGPHTLFHLPDSFEAYLASLAKRQRSNYRRDINVLNKEAGLDQQVYRGHEAVKQFDRFVELHREQWHAAGMLGHFVDWPRSEAFNREVVEKLSAHGNACLFELTGNGETLAMQYCLIAGDTCYWRLPARRAGAAFDRMGLGRVGLVKMIEALIDMGVRHIEAGPGHYDYKLKHGGEELQLTRILLARRGMIPKLKSHLLLLWADFIHFAYYRVWFLKLAPRLRMQRSLCGPWIRTRL